MNNGYQNEYDFVKLFNNKYLNELDQNSIQFLYELFGKKIKNDEPIISWKNKMVQKADIFIKYKNNVKGISLKCGNSNSMRHEQIQEFKMYLEKLGIQYNTINKYVSYHYGDAKDKEGKINFSQSLSSEEYKKIYQSEIDIFNNCINKTRIIVKKIIKVSLVYN